MFCRNIVDVTKDNTSNEMLLRLLDEVKKEKEMLLK